LDIARSGGSVLDECAAQILSNHWQASKDIKFKTYCSAAPKPGNLYFSYDYEADNQIGWSFTVVNGADWVPELPVSIQSIGDFNKTNPFKNVGNHTEKADSRKTNNGICLLRIDEIQP
jgi:hypothetical protein